MLACFLPFKIETQNYLNGESVCHLVKGYFGSFSNFVLYHICIICFATTKFYFIKRCHENCLSCSTEIIFLSRDAKQ